MTPPRYKHKVEFDNVVIYPDDYGWNLDIHWIAADSKDTVRVEGMR